MSTKKEIKTSLKDSSHIVDMGSEKTFLLEMGEFKEEDIGEDTILGGLRGGLDNISYSDLFELFGRPQLTPNIDNPGYDKTEVEWIGKINGVRFWIYDWKLHKPADLITFWCVGGREVNPTNLLEEYISSEGYYCSSDD